MRAQVLHEWGGELSFEDVPAPKPGAGEALVRVEACGVGLTVLNSMRGNLGQRREDLPRIPGHEAVGTVVEIGSGVAGLHPGQRVMVYFYLACGACDYCRLAHEPLCRNLHGNVGVARDGGYAEYLVLPAFNLLPLPDGIDPVAGTAIPDAIATPYHVSRRSAIGPGDVAMVIGAAGGVGIHMVQMARHFGADVIAVDVGAAKLAAARERGTVAALDFETADVREALRAAAPRGVSVAIDLVGNRETLAFAVDALGRRGRLVLLTTFPGVTVDLLPRAMVQQELSVIGSRYASRWEVSEAARLVADGRIQPVVSAVVALERVRELHARLRARTLLGRGAIAF
jgi:D-arabinose 1-dehydrogenase-like Zn-dependent alcohol dehydrogenase